MVVFWLIMNASKEVQSCTTYFIIKVFLQWIMAMTHGVTIFKQQENQQACYECTPFHPTKPIHHKWQRLCSLMLKNPCFWTSNNVTKSMQTAVFKCFKKLHMKIKNKHPGKITMAPLCCKHCPSVYDAKFRTSHAVEGTPTFWTCHLAIKWHTFAVDNGVQESKVVVEAAAQWIVCRYANICTNGTPTKYFYSLFLFNSENSQVGFSCAYII